MLSIEEIAVDVYNKNMFYIAEKHPQLYKDLQALDVAIQNKTYEEQYALEYINDNFDIRNLHTNIFEYDGNSNAFVKSTLQLINLDKLKGTIEGFSFFDVTQLNISNQDAIEDKKEIFKLMTYSINNISATSIMKQMNKFIYFGVGLGLHITAINSKYRCSDYLIIEDDIEKFKLSLFTTKYYDIAKNSRITFSILQDATHFTQNLEQFLQNNFNYNRYIKYYHMKNHSCEKIQLFQTAISNQAFVKFPYNRQLDLGLRPLDYLDSEYKFLDLHTTIKNDFFHDKPILVLAAGPSLTKHIEWLVNNHSNYLIIAVSAVLKTLYKHNIKPDIITHLDGLEETATFYEGFNVKDFLSNTICIFSSMTPKIIIDIFNKEQVYLYESITNYHEKSSVHTTECVGSFSYLLSVLLNSQEIYLLGLDLAFNQETGETHADGHSQNVKVNINSLATAPSKTNLLDTIFETEGNFSQTVYTNPIFYSSLLSLDKIIPVTISPTQKVFNISAGAKISMAEALSISKIKITNPLNKKGFKSLIQATLEDYSQSSLSSYDFKRLENEYSSLQNLKSHIVEYKKTYSKKDNTQYTKDLVKLFLNILEEKTLNNNSNIVKIYYSYFRYILPIVEDFFNTKNTSNTKHHIKKINSIFEEGLESIQERYQSTLHSFLKK